MSHDNAGQFAAVLLAFLVKIGGHFDAHILPPHEGALHAVQCPPHASRALLETVVH